MLRDSNCTVFVMADKSNGIAPIVKKLEEAKCAHIIKLSDNDTDPIQFVLKNRPEIVFLHINDSKGKTINFLYELYNFSNWLPYMIAVVDVETLTVKKRVSEHGLGRVFDSNDPNYTIEKPVAWMKKIIHNRSSMFALPCDHHCNSTDTMLRQKISKHLMNIGMSLHLAGFKYLVEAIIITMKNPGISLTGNINRQIAVKYNTSRHNVERCTRTAIELAWRDTDMRILAKNYPVPEMVYQTRPSTKKFVCCMADYILHELYSCPKEVPQPDETLNAASF